jgi:hypothetical protein
MRAVEATGVCEAVDGRGRVDVTVYLCSVCIVVGCGSRSSRATLGDVRGGSPGPTSHMPPPVDWSDMQASLFSTSQQ